MGLKDKIRTNQLHQLFRKKLDNLNSMRISNSQNLKVFIDEYLLFLEFCEEYKLAQEEKFLIAQEEFKEKINSFLLSFQSNFLERTNLLRNKLIDFRLRFEEIKRKDLDFQHSKNLLENHMCLLNSFIQRILNLDQELKPLYESLKFLRENLNSIIDNINDLKFLFLFVLYHYTDGLTGSDRFLRQSPKIELTDDFIILYSRDNLDHFKERVDYFNQICGKLSTNGFTLEYSPHRFRIDKTNKEFSPRYNSQDLIGNLKFKLSLLLKAFKNYIKLNEVLSSTYVSHLTGFDNFKNIIKNGALASQAYLVEKGLIPIPRSAGGQDQTLVDISFSFGLEMQYGEMGFIFPTTSLLQDHVFYLRASSQYTQFPELHIFDENFDENRNKKGTFVDLSRAILLIPKINKVPKTIEEKKALESVFKDLLMIEGVIRLLKMNLSKEEAFNDSQRQYSFGHGILGSIPNSYRYFEWQITAKELQEMLNEDKSTILRKLNQKIREYKSRPELEGLNIFVALEELASRSYILNDIEENMEYYLTYDVESYWRNYFYQLSQDRKSWFYGRDVDGWMAEHVIFYDRRIYLTIEKLMRNYSHNLGNLTSKQFNTFLRYLRLLFKKHAKPLLRKQPRGKIVPTNQTAKPLRRDKNIILFKFIDE